MGKCQEVKKLGGGTDGILARENLGKMPISQKALKINSHIKLYSNWTMEKWSRTGRGMVGKGGMLFSEEGDILNKCKLHQCHPEMNLLTNSYHNRTMGRCSKLKGRGCKRQKLHPKINQNTKFYLNRTIGKCSNLKNANVTNTISK